jgi:hypothetical protein
MRGLHYRVGPITGLSPMYSGVERHLQGLFRQIVREGHSVIDVGANWGIHTLYLQTKGGLKSMESGVLSSDNVPDPKRSSRLLIIETHSCQYFTCAFNLADPRSIPDALCSLHDHPE